MRAGPSGSVSRLSALESWSQAQEDLTVGTGGTDLIWGVPTDDLRIKHKGKTLTVEEVPLDNEHTDAFIESKLHVSDVGGAVGILVESHDRGEGNTDVAEKDVLQAKADFQKLLDDGCIELLNNAQPHFIMCAFWD